MKTIVRIEFGSHLYGTNTPTSDHDFKGIHIPEAESILLQRVTNSTGHKVIRPEGERNTPEDTDDESYSLQKYLSLLAEGQTVAIDMLFAPKPLIKTDLWEHIKNNKEKMLTKKSASFVGYCRTQANKYGIRGSRVAAAKKAMEFFQKAVDVYGPLHKLEHIDYLLTGLEDDHTVACVVQETTPGKFESYFECCNRKVGYKNTFKEALKIFTAIYTEYGERSRLAEINEGIDWKALSHAVRVGYEALELLKEHSITFPLWYAPHLLNIKLGKVPYKAVAAEIEGLLFDVEEAAKVSSLPDEPDKKFIDDLVSKVYSEEVFEKYFSNFAYSIQYNNASGSGGCNLEYAKESY